MSIACSFTFAPQKTAAAISDLWRSFTKLIKSADKNLSIFSINLEKVGEKKTLNICEKKAIEIINRKDTKLTKKTVNNWINKIFGNGTSNKKEIKDAVERWFKNSKYSIDCLDLVKELGVRNIYDVWIEEDSKSIRITIPNGYKVKVDWSTGLFLKLYELKKKGIYGFINIEGSLTVKLPVYRASTRLGIPDDNIQNQLFDYFSHNINELTIVVTDYGVKEEDPDRISRIDLSMHTIEKLTVKLQPARLWNYKQHKTIIKPEIILNDSAKPKVYKVQDHFMKDIDEYIKEQNIK